MLDTTPERVIIPADDQSDPAKTPLRLKISPPRNPWIDVEFTSRTTAQTVIECLLIIPMLGLILWFFFDSAIKPHLIDRIEKFHRGEVYHNSELGLDIEFYTSGWTQVAIGTFSSKEDSQDVVAEFESPIKGSFYIIWNQGTDADATGISRYRQQQFLEGNPDGNCRQLKKFAKSSQNINVYTSCAESDLVSHQNQYSTLINSQGVYYELSGYFYSSKTQYKGYIKTIKRMANEFEAAQ
jgi:hypothetical protein